MSAATMSIVSDRSSAIRLIQTSTSSSQSARGLQHSSSSVYIDSSVQSNSQSDFRFVFPTSSINYEPIPATDNSFHLTTSTNASKDLDETQYPQRYPQTKRNEVTFSSGIEPHAANVPGLVRRSSSRRKVVVNRAPSIRSERQRFSTISEHTADTYTSDPRNINKYGYTVPKRKLFKFIKRKDSVKCNYRHRHSLDRALDGADEYRQGELYFKNKQEPLVVQTFNIKNTEKLKAHPRLEHHLKLVSIDLHNDFCFEDPTEDLIEMYYHNYEPVETPIPKRTISRQYSVTPRQPSLKRKTTSSSRRSIRSRNSTTASEKDFQAFKEYIFSLRTSDSHKVFQNTQATPDQIKRLAMTIYLRRLVSAKIGLRNFLENSSSSYLTTKTHASVPTVKTRDLFTQPNESESQFNFISHKNVNKGEYSPPRPPQKSIASPNSSYSGRFESLIDMSFPSSGSALTFHSFK